MDVKAILRPNELNLRSESYAPPAAVIQGTIASVDARNASQHGNVRVRAPGPRSRITAAQKLGIRLQPRSDFALQHGRRERNFWMQRRSARNRHSTARMPAETKIREMRGRKSPQKRTIWRRGGNLRFAE